jgi:hypothetical protein
VAACKETSFLHLIMEAKKRIKRPEPDEIEEIMMEEESDEELEVINDSIDPHDNVSSSSSAAAEAEAGEDDDYDDDEEEEDDDNEELEMQFCVRRRGDSANILDFSLDLRMV